MFTSDQLAETLTFLQNQAKAETNPAHAEYWRTTIVIAADATMKALNIENGTRRDGRPAMPQSLRNAA